MDGCDEIGIDEISTSVFHLKFLTRRKLAMSFLRLQEFYECPHFKGRCFTLEEYAEWYADRYGAFTYVDDWCGFNVPDYAVQPFLEGRFDPLSNDEKDLLAAVAGLAPEPPYYLIGTLIGDDASINHELAHAFWYLDAEYQDRMKALITRLPEKFTADFRDVLLGMGYREEVVEDEMQAHLANGRLPCEMERYAGGILELSFDMFVTFRTKLADHG